MLCKNLTVQFELGAAEDRIRGHPTPLEQGLWNVIKNAVKFTAPVASYGCVESVAVIHDIARPLGILLETEVRA